LASRFVRHLYGPIQAAREFARNSPRPRADVPQKDMERTREEEASRAADAALEAHLEPRIARVVQRLGMTPAQAERLRRAVRLELWRDPIARALVMQLTGRPPPRPLVAPTARPRETRAPDEDDGDEAVPESPWSEDEWELQLRRCRRRAPP
jgi:hypothetical protein